MKRKLSFSQSHGEDDESDRAGKADTTNKAEKKDPTPKKRAAKSKAAKKQKVEPGEGSKPSSPEASTVASPKAPNPKPPSPPARSSVPKQVSPPPKAAPKKAAGPAAVPKAAVESPVPKSTNGPVTKKEESKAESGDEKRLKDVLNRARTVDGLNGDGDGASQMGDDVRSTAGSEARSHRSKKGKGSKKRDKKTHALKMRFYRSLNSPKKAQKMAVLFEEWLSSAEDWNRSKLVQSVQQSQSFSKRGARKWFTRQELALKYGSGKGVGNFTVADEIIKNKTKDPLSAEQCIRKHPDAPENKELTQYLCFDEAGECEQEDTVLTSLFQGVAAAGRNRKEKKDKKKRKKDSSSDSSRSSEEDSDSSSDEGSDDSSSESNRKSKKSKKGKKSKKSKKGKSKNKGKKKTKEAKEKDKEKEEKRKAEKRLQEIRAAAKKAGI
eukprot:s621_g36.t1